MGDDSYNPFTAETYVKEEPFWKLALYAVAFVFLVGLALWGTTVALFSLDPVNVAVKK